MQIIYKLAIIAISYSYLAINTTFIQYILYVY